MIEVQDNDCHLVVSHRLNSKGRLQINRNGKMILLYRVLWELSNGPIPDDKILMHRCDNPACVNILHLHLGKQADNVRDMIAKGRDRKRGSPGSTHWNWQGGISRNYKRKVRNGKDDRD